MGVFTSWVNTYKSPFQGAKYLKDDFGLASEKSPKQPLGNPKCSSHFNTVLI